MLRLVSAAACAALALAAPAAAAPGDLDKTFSSDGIEMTDFGDNDFVRDVAPVPGGGLVAVGGTSLGDDFAVARYQPDGTPDTTFSGDGRQTFNPGGLDRAQAVVVQPDGKVVVAGYADAGTLSQPAVVRLKQNGEPDESFSLDGVMRIDTSGMNGGNVYDLALQPDGKIVAVGDAYMAGGDDLLAARLTTAGVQDSTFSGDGVAIVDASPGSTDAANAVAVGPQGEIALAGVADTASFDDLVVAKLDAQGAPVAAFGPGGKRYFDIDGDDEVGEGIAFNPDGSLIVSGWFDFLNPAPPNFGDMVVLKVNSAGQLDPAFGTGGKRTINITGARDEGGKLELGPGGSIVVGGWTDPTPGVFGDDNSDIAVSRLTPDGNFDSTWSGDGHALIDFGDDNTFGDLTIEPGRGVAVVLDHGDHRGDFTVARLSVEPDNCPAEADPDQTDTDGDGQGDLCDPNDDNDPFSDAVEAAMGTNPRSADTDGDGRGDGADACPTLAANTPNGCPAPQERPVADTTAPSFTLAGLRSRVTRKRFLRSGLAGAVTPNEPAAFEIQLLGRVRGARIARAGDVVLAERNLSRAAGRRSFSLRPGRSLRRRYARRMSLRLKVVAIDAAGNRSTATRRIAIR